MKIKVLRFLSVTLLRLSVWNDSQTGKLKWFRFIFHDIHLWREWTAKQILLYSMGENMPPNVDYQLDDIHNARNIPTEKLEINENN